MDELVFASRTGARLVLVPTAGRHDGRPELPAWEARLSGEGLDASISCREAGWEPQSLADFLAALAADSRGQGERTWQSEEAELRLAARRDGRNTVIISVELEDGAPPRWRCEAELELDPGAVEELAARARRLADGSLAP